MGWCVGGDDKGVWYCGGRGWGWDRWMKLEGVYWRVDG